MRTSRTLASVGLFAALSILVALGLATRGIGGASQASGSAAPGQTVPAGDFVVHEWGTFTSFSGSDSVKLEFRPLVDFDLPPFVLDRGRQAGNVNPFMKLDRRVLQRMETPVTYFYSDVERQVKVRVGFPQGMLTEFFPPVLQQQPDFNWLSDEPLSGSVLDWGQVWIVPEDRVRADVVNSKLAAQLQATIHERLLPASDNHDHYSYSRETDSALVYVERAGRKDRPLAPRGAYFEKFLFYRGIGNFELPVQLTAQPGERFELKNTGTDEIRSLFLVTVAGDELRFVKHDGIGAGQTLPMAQSDQASSVDELAEAVVAALIDERLFEKEARAMVKTWRSSWFGEDGTRLFYILPQSITEELLPLTIEPRPDDVVRVMVGRLEIMRPEDETRITRLVEQSSRDRAALREALPDQVYALPQAILDLGRLAEPALVRVQTLAADAATRGEAQLLLEQLRQHRDALAQAALPVLLTPDAEPELKP